MHADASALNCPNGGAPAEPDATRCGLAPADAATGHRFDADVECEACDGLWVDAETFERSAPTRRLRAA